jgi:hypothetical protein
LNNITSSEVTSPLYTDWPTDENSSQTRDLIHAQIPLHAKQVDNSTRMQNLVNYFSLITHNQNACTEHSKDLSLDRISSGYQYKEPVKFTAHSSQQTQDDCTSTNLLEDETRQYTNNGQLARYCCSVRADKLLAGGSAQHALAPPLTRTPSALPLKPRQN